MKNALGVLVVVLVGFALFVATRPAHFKLSRALAMHAPADVVYSQIADFHEWAGWSPWDKMDPSMKRTYGGADRGVGATYAWHGNDKVGIGSMTMRDARPSSRVVVSLDLEKPMKAHHVTTFSLLPHGERTTLVTWSLEGDNGFVGKTFSVFVDMDKMIGRDFERGLDTLKSIAEGEAAKGAELQRAEAHKREAAQPQATLDGGASAPPNP